MVTFFFYNNLTQIELIKKINTKFEIYDGYILINNYDIENNILEINKRSLNNNKLLCGKIVNFNKMKLEDVIKKINEIEEFKIQSKTKYNVETIWTNKTLGGTYKAYIIY
jgi:hypothetical protein